MATSAKLRPENMGGASLTEVYNAAARDYHDALPTRLANLFLSVEGEPVYVAPEAAARVTQHAAGVKKMIAARLDEMDARNTAGMAGLGTIAEGSQLKHLSLDDETPTILISKQYDPHMSALSLFDHEMGHLLVREGNPAITNPHMAECAADAFAVLRHIQRFGRRDDIAEVFSNALRNRTNAVVAGNDPSFYYTTAVIQKIADIQRRGTVDIPSLSLRDTAKLAGELAIQYSYGQDELDKIREAFAPVRALYKEKGRYTPKALKTLADIMLANKDNDEIFRAGRLILHHRRHKKYLDKLTYDRDFQTTLAALKRHEKESGIIIDAARARDTVRDAKLEKNKGTPGRLTGAKTSPPMKPNI